MSADNSNTKCVEILPLSEDDVLAIDAQFPKPFGVLTTEVDSLEACARQQIEVLTNTVPMSPEDEDALDDGFFLCDLNVIQNKLHAWRRMFPRIHPYYAIKCNPCPMTAAVLGVLGASFDCASLAEIELALQSAGDNPKRIVYANPQRAERALEESLQLGVQAMTFDGEEELYKIHRAASTSTTKPHMILRILVPDEKSTVPLGEKFGASPAAIAPLTRLAQSLDLPIVGVSFHCGSGNHDPESYADAIRLAGAAMEEIDQIQAQQPSQRPCWLLDIGGGYPGVDGGGGDGGRFCGNVTSVGHNPSVHQDVEHTTWDIAQVITPLLDELFSSDIHVIAEPGRYFVESAFGLCSRIYQVVTDQQQQQQHRHYYIAQGVQGVFKDCILCDESFVPVPLRWASRSNDNDMNKSVAPSTIHGPSGEDYDVICRDIELPLLSVGDWLIFDRMGAYTLSIAARHGQTPIRYVMGRSKQESS